MERIRFKKNSEKFAMVFYRFLDFQIDFHNRLIRVSAAFAELDSIMKRIRYEITDISAVFF